MTSPILSIIIPVYNAATTIENIVNEILAQPFSDFELILVNDKSPDNSLNIIKKLAKKDSRIIVINKTVNQGPAEARNSGLLKVHGKYVMFFDADDSFDPDMMQNFIKAIKSKSDYQLVNSGFTIQTIKDGKILQNIPVCTEALPKQGSEHWRQYIIRLLGIDGRLYAVWGKLYLTDIIKKNNLRFQSGVNFGEDLMFNLDYFAAMTGKIKFIYNKPYYIYRQESGVGEYSKSSLVYQYRIDNYNYLLDFTKSVPDSPAKSDLLHWVLYSWFYSFLMAIQQSKLSTLKKHTIVKSSCRKFIAPPLGDVHIIGKNKRHVERIIRLIASRPFFAYLLLRISILLRRGHILGAIWRALRRRLNTI